MKIFTLFLFFTAYCQNASAQIFVDTGDCNIYIPKEFKLLLETVSSDRVVFESTSNLSTINLDINKRYRVKDSEMRSSANGSLNYAIISQTSKYAVVRKTRTLKEKKIGFTEIYLNGLRVTLLGPNNDWSGIVNSCK